MSKKRSATTDINHENWDREDPAEHEEMGNFTPANSDIIEKRVIRTAKRRAANSSDGTTRSVFSGFGGFSKAQPSSFDFLANLTNGTKPSSGSPSSKSDTTVSSSLFSTNSGSGSSGVLFSVPVSSTSTTKSTFVMPNSQSSSSFGGPISTSSTSAFTASKADSTVGNFSFKPHAPASVTDNTSKTDSTSASAVSSTMFGIPPNNTETIKTLFSTAATSSPFKIQPVPSKTASSSTPTVSADNKTSSDKPEDSDKKLRYYTKLKGLNESVSDWIKKHVENTPLCILSPIFKDYEKHLKDIQEEYHGADVNDVTKKHSEDKVAAEPKSESTTVNSSPFSGTGSSFFSNSNLLKTNASSPFSTQSSPLNSIGADKVPSANNLSSTPKPSFSFGVNSSSLNTTLTTNTASSPPFSFGVGKPFSNNSNEPKPTEADNNAEEADDGPPPETDFTPVEEDSVYDKKCKIFINEDGKYVVKGVGTLFIKKIEESGKHQLLVRAHSKCGNVILNLILVSSIPTQRLGKNNVIMVCIPTPNAKPPPVSVLVRVKTSEEADELLETLNKYKA